MNDFHLLSTLMPVVFLILFIILSCFFYYMFRKHAIMAGETNTTTTMTTTTTRHPQQQPVSHGGQYPPYQPVPAQPGYSGHPAYGGQPMPTGPYQGQTCAPGPPPSYQEATIITGIPDQLQSSLDTLDHNHI